MLFLLPELQNGFCPQLKGTRRNRYYVEIKRGKRKEEGGKKKEERGKRKEERGKKKEERGKKKEERGKRKEERGGDM